MREFTKCLEQVSRSRSSTNREICIILFVVDVSSAGFPTGSPHPTSILLNPDPSLIELSNTNQILVNHSRYGGSLGPAGAG